MCIVKAHYISGIFHDGKLHTETQTEERNVVSSRISDGFDLTVNASGTEAAGNKNTVYVGKKVVHIFIRNSFGINPLDVDSGAIGNTAVFESFHHTDIGIMKLHIFADNGNGHIMNGGTECLHHRFPVCQVWFRTFEV